MAAQGNAVWTVLIIAEEGKFNRTYELSQDSTLNEIMNTWTEECGQSGYWVFTSLDKQDRYLDSMTLKMVGETVLNSGVVNLRVKKLEESRPTSGVFAHVNDECRYIEVHPQHRLHEVLRCLPRRPRELEHNGTLLNLTETVGEAGLKNNDVVQERCRQISVNVKLSNGDTMIFQVAENSFVLHLVEKVKKYETDDFSLIHLGRFLHMQDRVRDLRQVVEVSMAQFVVDIYGQSISWTTRSEPINYPHFISQLSFHGQLDIKELEMMEFSCVGCRRSIFKSQDIQLLPVQCCREKSLTLTATSPSNTRTREAIQEVLMGIERVMEQIHQGSETKLQSGVPRGLCKDFYETLEESELMYNANIEFVVKIKKTMERMKDKINKIETENESLKANSVTLQKELSVLRTNNVALEASEKTLEATKSDLETNIQGFERLVRCLSENTGVKLLVWYDRNEFSPVISRPEIQLQEVYMWGCTDRFHVKCVIPELQPGWTTFEKVRDALQPLFSDNIIRMIGQLRSSIKGKEFAKVTCLADDEVPRYLNQNEYCDEEGQQLMSKKAKELRESHKIREGGRVLICGGQRRTAIGIWHF